VLQEAPAPDLVPRRPFEGVPGATVTNLRALLWSGPLGVVMVFFGLFVMAGFFPPPSPHRTGAEMAHIWQHHSSLKMAGLILCFCGGTLYLTFTLAIGYLLRRCTDDVIMPITQTALGVFGTVYFSFNFLILATAGFRPYLSADSTQTLHDLGFIMTFSPAAPFFLQYTAIAMTVFQIPDAKPLIPRWVAYFNIWVAIGLVPPSFIPLFKSGPLAWNGLLGFYIPVVVFGAWYVVMFTMLRRLLPRKEATR
jgi:hypothetical protein